MFDIVSFIRERIFRRPKLTTLTIGEELSEKQTTKLGYFLLYCMFAAILMSAQWTLYIIREIPDQPKAIPTCISSLLSVFEVGSSNYSFYENQNSYAYNGYNTCDLVSNNPKYDFTNSYNSLLGSAQEINSYGEQLRNLENENSNLLRQKRDAQDDYNTALTEKIAREENGAIDKNEVKETLQNSKSQLESVEASIASVRAQIESIRTTHASQVEELKAQYKQAGELYHTAYLTYKLIVAILSLLFAVIVFSFLYRIYIVQKIKNSPHAIIFSVATFAYGLVLIQIVGMFLWDIIPHKIFALLAELFAVFTPLLYLVQFLWPVLIIVVFGYLVFRIQKRLYSPQNVLKRFISDKKCPKCGNGVDFTKPYCPLCSHEIQIHCPHCHELTLKGMPYCSSCGGKLPESDKEITHDSLTSFDDVFKNELSKISIEEYSGVVFSGNGIDTFTMKRANIIRIALYLTHKLEKTEFAPKELIPFLEEIEKHITTSLPKAEQTRVIGRIHSWMELGGKVEFMKK